MKKLQLINTIDALSRVVNISEKQKQELINKYKELHIEVLEVLQNYMIML